jgi:hypothetical protein
MRNFLLCPFVYDVAMGARGSEVHIICFPGALVVGLHEVLSS